MATVWLDTEFPSKYVFLKLTSSTKAWLSPVVFTGRKPLTHEKGYQRGDSTYTHVKHIPLIKKYIWERADVKVDVDP